MRVIGGVAAIVVVTIPVITSQIAAAAVRWDRGILTAMGLVSSRTILTKLVNG